MKQNVGFGYWLYFIHQMLFKKRNFVKIAHSSELDKRLLFHHLFNQKSGIIHMFYLKYDFYISHFRKKM